MPYIRPEDREGLLDKNDFPDCAGQLNFLMHSLIEDYLDQDELTYERINDIMGALSSVQQEFYRRIAIPYEDKKKELNGDISLYEKYGV